MTQTPNIRRALPLGSNKTTVFEELLKEFPDKFGFPLASTTREPNEGEIDGVHYMVGTHTPTKPSSPCLTIYMCVTLGDLTMSYYNCPLVHFSAQLPEPFFH